MEAGWEGAGGQCPAHTSHEINPLLNFKTSRRKFATSLVLYPLCFKPLDQDSFRPPSLQFSVYFSPLSFHSLLTDLIYHLQILSPIIASAIPSMLKFLWVSILISFSPFDRVSLVNLKFWIPSLLLSFLREAIPPRVQPICRWFHWFSLLPISLYLLTVSVGRASLRVLPPLPSPPVPLPPSPLPHHHQVATAHFHISQIPFFLLLSC